MSTQLQFKWHNNQVVGESIDHQELDLGCVLSAATLPVLEEVMILRSRKEDRVSELVAFLIFVPTKNNTSKYWK
jgi:hypothetical protein